MSKGKVLIIDDEKSIREFLKLFLKNENYEVVSCESAIEGLEILKTQQIDLVLLDIQMPKMNGLEALISFKKIDPTLEIIIITAFSSTDLAVDVIKKGAYDFITKPFQLDDFKLKIAKAIEKRKLINENINLKSQIKEKYVYSNMVGSSKPMLLVYELIKIVSQTTSNILITGESGTGKELVAKAIHENGELKTKPFVVVNCGAIPENLIESELFGHKKGSFTGAINEKIGLFEIANDGTLFLDEVSELPLHLQVKILRAIQERTVRRIGETKDISINVRIIAATNKNLEELVKKNQFRKDLFYRLNVIEIQVPPLRNRSSDILMLANHFIEKFSKKIKKPQKKLSKEAIEALLKYNYLGNVRELENIIERAVALSTTPTIELKDLTTNVIHYYKEKPETKDVIFLEEEIPSSGIDLEDLVSTFEKDLINKALTKTQGVKKQAAKLLGISFRSLRYRLEKYSID